MGVRESLIYIPVFGSVIRVSRRTRERCMRTDRQTCPIGEGSNRSPKPNIAVASCRSYAMSELHAVQSLKKALHCSREEDMVCLKGLFAAATRIYWVKSFILFIVARNMRDSTENILRAMYTSD